MPTNWNKLSFDPTRMNWGINDLQILEEGWKKRKLRGKGIRVAVLDSGIRSEHPDLADAFGRKPAFHFSHPIQPPMSDDDGGHGTRCGGLVAATGKELVYGVAPQASLVVGKIQPSPASLKSAVDWCLTLRQKPNIILTSLQLSEEPNDPAWQADLAALKTSLDNAVQQGIVVVAAVGNSKQARAAFFPASFGNCIAVGAVLGNMTRHQESARTDTIDVVAPGHAMLTTDQPGRPAADFQKTSAAAAFTAGVLALAMQHARALGKPPLSPAEWRQLLRDTADFRPAFASAGPRGQNREFGFGLVNPLGIFQKLETTA